MKRTRTVRKKQETLATLSNPFEGMDLSPVLREAIIHEMFAHAKLKCKDGVTLDFGSLSKDLDQAMSIPNGINPLIYLIIAAYCGDETAIASIREICRPRPKMSKGPVVVW